MSNVERGKKGQMLCHARDSGLRPIAPRDHRRGSGRIMVHQTDMALTAVWGGGFGDEGEDVRRLLRE